MARILVVDDEVEICSLIKGVFLRNGHDVDVVHNGEDALIRLRDNFYDAMVLDLVMPGMSGNEVLDHREAYAETAVIILTAHSSTSSAVKALRHKVSDYLEKPIELQKLVEMVEKYITWHSYKSFKIHMPTYRAYYQGKLIENMTTGLFRIFSIFVRYPDRFFTYQDIATLLVRENPDFYKTKKRQHLLKSFRRPGGIGRETATQYLAGQMSRLRRGILDPLLDGKEVLVNQNEIGFGWSRNVSDDLG